MFWAYIEIKNIITKKQKVTQQEDWKIPHFPYPKSLSYNQSQRRSVGY